MALSKSSINDLKKWPIKSISKREVLRSGFEYTGREDFLRCIHCTAIFGDWKDDDDPVEAHLNLAPECEFIQKVAKTYKRPSLLKRSPPANPEKASLKIRLETFADFPAGIEIPHKNFAEAGFYYIGRGDTVACFYCDGRLNDWNDYDDPLTDHAYWFPACHFIELVCGRTFIESIKNKSDENTQKLNIREFDERSSVIQQFKKICPKCNKSQKNACFVPCGHVVACDECSELITDCEICKEQVTKSIRVYL